MDALHHLLVVIILDVNTFITTLFVRYQGVDDADAVEATHLGSQLLLLTLGQLAVYRLRVAW